MTTATAPATVPPSLNILATYDPAAALKSDVRWQRVWQVATAVLPVAYTALAILALSIVTTLWPAHLPITTILLAGGVPTTTNVFRYMLGKIDHYKKQAATNQELKAKVELISTEKLNKTLNQLGFSSSAEISVQKTLLARYQFLEKRAVAPKEDPSQVALDVEGQVHTINPDDYTIKKVNFQEDPKQVKIFDTLQKHQIRYIGQTINAALQHLQAAHALYLIQNPKDTRGMDEMAKPTTDNPLHHVIADHMWDTSAFVLIQTKKGKEYALGDILDKSAVELAHEIFGLTLNKEPLPN